MRPNIEGYEEILGYRKALSDVKTKILELNPTFSYLSPYQEGQQDLCDKLLDYIESLKNKPYAS